MTAMKLTKADMDPAIGYVPGGVIEIMKRQSEGWAYIRPGFFWPAADGIHLDGWPYNLGRRRV
jgi:hypothetical protein